MLTIYMAYPYTYEDMATQEPNIFTTRDEAQAEAKRMYQHENVSEVEISVAQFTDEQMEYHGIYFESDGSLNYDDTSTWLEALARFEKLDKITPTGETVAEMFKVYEEHYEKEQRISEQVLAEGFRHKEYIEEMERRFPNHRELSFWLTSMTPKIASQIKEAGNYHRVEVLGPMGIGCRVAFHCFPAESTTLEECHRMTIEPVLSDPESSPFNLVHTNERDGSFKKGTIGSINGLDHPVTPICTSTRGKDWLRFLDK